MNISHLLQWDPLVAAGNGALVLTATKRLARQLRRQFDRQQEEAGHQAWPTPAIHSGDAWLMQAGDAIGEGWRLLGTLPARMLWEKIVTADAAGSDRELLQAGATARLAEEAHALVTEYGGAPDAFPLTADHLSFQRWRSVYRETLRKEGWLDRLDIAERVVAALTDGRLAVPSQVLFVGFDELPPRFVRIAGALRHAGREARCISPALEPGRLQRLACADAREEVRRAACWARALLERGEDEIGIVVPKLEEYRPLLERIFREEIDPSAHISPGGEEVRFNLSLGVSLAEKGAVAAALAILTAESPMKLPEAGFLLRTPYLGGTLRESAARARLDRHLRRAGETEVSLANLRSLAQKGENTRHTATIFGQLSSSVQDRSLRTPGEWGGRFAAMLQEVGWPGDRPLDSLDFQVVKAFREKVLLPLAAFDFVSGKVPYGEALGLLRRLATETEFQPEGVESPVQVVGVLEAAGLNFRHLWVMGLHDGALPAPPRPNPFLPLLLQRAAGMPHADAEREGRIAREVAARLFAAAPLVVLSHPQRSGDAALLPSPLIASLPAVEMAIAPSRAPQLFLRQRAPVAEALDDWCGPPLAEGEQASGGTALLRDQALCPFRAFAQRRLAAVALETPDIGLDGRERGNLLHKSMEIFWQQTKSRQALLMLSSEELRSRIEDSIAAAVHFCHRETHMPALSVLLDLEKQRLRQLIMEWLEKVEMPRDPFTVMEEEQECTASFGGMSFTTRIDRIDRLEDGRLVVLDYKTGPVDASDLIGDRLIEPQLPIYGLEREKDGMAAVAFASLRRGKCTFAGVAAEGGILPKVPALNSWKKGEALGLEWPELLGRWRRQLDELARSFANGEAAVDPVSSQKACRFCDLLSLCRLADAAVVEPEEAGE